MVVVWSKFLHRMKGTDGFRMEWHSPGRNRKRKRHLWTVWCVRYETSIESLQMPTKKYQNMNLTFEIKETNMKD